MADLLITGASPLRADQYVRPAAAQAATGTVAPASQTSSGQTSSSQQTGGGATPTFAGGLSQSTLLTAQSPGQQGSGKSSLTGLTDEEEAEVRQLKQTDAKVRAHELAHQAAGGQYASGPSYQYQRGPDGGLYAVAGEVSIDTSPVPGDAQATIAKANQIRAAALAPADPSAQDRSVANAAAQLAARASAEATKQQNGETDETAPSATSPRTDPAAQAATNAYDAVNALVSSTRQQPAVDLAA